MNNILEVIDKTGRLIRMPKKQWLHILRRHPYMEKYFEEIQETLKKPDKLIDKPFQKGDYYKGYKYLNSPNRFVLVVVKYLNGDGFAITAHLVESIK